MKKRRLRALAMMTMVTLVTLGVATSRPLTVAARAGAPSRAGDDPESDTATPIKHVIVLIGENRTFDNIFATYVPKSGDDVTNLLSRGIVHADGSPGGNSAAAEQSRLTTINPVAYFIDTDQLKNPGKLPYAPHLPTPEVGFAPPEPVTLAQLLKDPADTVAPFDATTFSLKLLHTISPVRIANVNSLGNSVFPLAGDKLPYDSYTGDMVHRFYHMWQQSDCNVMHATPSNPSGCRNDLYPYVGIARDDDSGANSMGFYNVQNGDAPVFKRLADRYTMSDNYHQPVMGGTAVQHMMLMTGDAIPWEHFDGFPAQPPLAQVADPTPKSATNAGFTRDARWTKCGDQSQPGILPIVKYLQSLPWRPDKTASNCAPGLYYMINNTRPGYLSDGSLNSAAITAGSAVPPSSLRTIGDALNEKNISWAYYGGGFNAAARFDSGSTDPIDVLIGTGGDFYCDICNPFQYVKSIMGVPAQRKAHIKDAIDFFAAIDSGQLPAVSYLKPDSFDDGHPASSKLDVLEALIERVVDKLESHPELFEDTAFIVTFDEGGGYWDSGSFQPIDFFGDGPRIPFIVVSKFTRGGHIVHSYGDHASVLKFIERNWRLKPLTARSRDNLPNPITAHGNPYVPVNMPAIGDLFDMFDFDRDR